MSTEHETWGRLRAAPLKYAAFVCTAEQRQRLWKGAAKGTALQSPCCCCLEKELEKE